MRTPVRIGLVGDLDDPVPAHRANPLALQLAAAELGVSVEAHWLPTGTITQDADLAGFAGLWCVPASPYRSMAGALRAIAFARREGVPFLGTCGGFQHAVVEYARAVLGWADAEHAETAPDAPLAVITALDCARRAPLLQPRLKRSGQPLQHGRIGQRQAHAGLARDGVAFDADR